MIDDVKKKIRKADAVSDASKAMLDALQNLDVAETALRDAEAAAKRPQSFFMGCPSASIVISSVHIRVPHELLTETLSLLQRVCQCHVANAVRQGKAAEEWDGSPETRPAYP